MNNEIIFTVKDLIMSVLWITIIIFIVYLILILKELFMSVRMVRLKLKEKNEEIDHIINKAPSIVDSVEKITGIASKTVEGAYKGVSGIVKKYKKK